MDRQNIQEKKKYQVTQKLLFHEKKYRSQCVNISR